MGKKLARFLTLILATAFLSACAHEPIENEHIPDGYERRYITFPTSLSEKNEYNAPIFDIEPFALEVYLPEGWTIEEAAVATQNGQTPVASVDGIFSIQYLFNEKGEPVGSIGYNLAPAVEGANRDPMALFAGITLAQHHFDCKEAFTPIIETATQLLALTDVIHNYPVDGQTEEKGITTNYGILLRDESIGVYVAIELETDTVTENQVNTIATSLSLRKE